jgi:tetrahydromethanopterin:alpha-L-glutamate ligase
MKQIAVIGIPGKWSSERLAECLEKKTGFRLLAPMHDFSLDLSRGRVLCRGRDASPLSAIVVKKIGPDYSQHMLNRLEMLGYAKHLGIPVFSDPAAVGMAANRLSCTLTLRRGNIPMPETVITESIDTALDTVERFSRAVFKPLFSSKARGMRVIDAGPQAPAAIEAFRDANNPVMYIQKMIAIPGKDLGLVFLGGEYIGTYARVVRSDSWNTTTHFGGTYASHSPSHEIIELASRAQALFGLDFTCVDIAETPDGPVVFEVSAFGGFRGLLEANDIDAAELYADYIVRKCADG